MRKRIIATIIAGLLAVTSVPVISYAENGEEFTSAEVSSDEIFTDMPEETENVQILRDDGKAEVAIEAELDGGGNVIDANIGDGTVTFTVKVVVKSDVKPDAGSVAIEWGSSITIEAAGQYSIVSATGIKAKDFSESDGKYIYTGLVPCEIKRNNTSVPIDGISRNLVVTFNSDLVNIATTSSTTDIQLKINPYQVDWTKTTAWPLRHDYMRLDQTFPTGINGDKFCTTGGQLLYAILEKQEETPPDPNDDQFDTNWNFKNLKEDTEYWVWKKAKLKNGYTGAISPGVIIKTKAVESIECTAPPKLSYTVGDTLNPSNLKIKFNYTDNSSEGGYGIGEIDANWSFYIGEDKIENLSSLPTVTMDHDGKELKMVYTKTDGTKVEATLGTLQVSKKQQDAVNVTDIPQNLTYGDAPFTLTVSGGSGSGAEVSYEVTEGQNVLKEEKGKLKVMGAGDAKVIVTKAGDEEYAPVESEEIMIHVNKAVPKIELTDDWFYLGSININPKVTGVNGGVAPTGKITYTWYEDLAGTKLLQGTGKEPGSTGTYYVKASLEEDTCYEGAESGIAEIRITYRPVVQPLPDNIPDGSKKLSDGTYVTPNGTQVKPDGTIILPDGTALSPDAAGKASIEKNGTVTTNNGIKIDAEGNITVPDTSTEKDVLVTTGDNGAHPKFDPTTGQVITVEGSKVISPDGKGGKVERKPEAGTIITEKGEIILTDGTKIDIDGNSHNTDGSVTDFDGNVIRPATPVIKNAFAANGKNMVSVILKEECAGAQGYDYVISKNPNCIVDKDYLQVNKNKLEISTDFRYIQQGDYYVYCHAWYREENGKKRFSKWSEGYQLTVSAVTPTAPQIKKVSVKGNTVTVVYTKSKNATGYDLVLGKKEQKVYGELRPVAYDKNVVKVKKGNQITATFKNVKKGTYYVGMHAYNRTSDNNKKVFSPWSNIKSVRVK